MARNRLPFPHLAIAYIVAAVVYLGLIWLFSSGRAWSGSMSVAAAFNDIITRGLGRGDEVAVLSVAGIVTLTLIAGIHLAERVAGDYGKSIRRLTVGYLLISFCAVALFAPLLERVSIGIRAAAVLTGLAFLAGLILLSLLMTVLIQARIAAKSGATIDSSRSVD